MQLSRSSGSAIKRWLATAAIVFCLTAAPASADGLRTDDKPAAREAPPAETVMATESAARLGIERARTTDRAEINVAQPTDPATKWLLIIGISALAIALIVLIAD